MKLHLPIGLRKALMAVFAALVVSPVIAKDVRDGEFTKITGPHAVQDSYFETGQIYKEVTTGMLWWAETTYYYGGNSLKMTGAETNRIETGLLGSKKYVLTGPWNDQSFTVAAKGNVTMSTNEGVNIISGNAAEIRGALTTIIDSSYGGLMEWLSEQVLPEVEFAPTVKATGEVLVDGLESGNVLMDGPANAVMLGSTVEGKNITMQNSGDQITSAGALMDGLMYSTLETIGKLKADAPAAIRAKLAPLNQFQGNFNIVQGSNIGTEATVKVKMDASLVDKDIPDDVDPLAANIILGDSNVTAKDIELTGMASVITNTKMSDAANALATFITTKDASELMLVQNLLGSGTATSLTATTGNIKLGSQFNVLHGGNLDVADEALKLTANNGAVNIQGTANVLSGNVKVNAGSINLKGERLEGDLPGMVDGMISSLTDQIDGSAAIVDKLVKKGSFNVVTGGATLNATGNIVLNDQPVDDVGATGVINAVLDTELTDLITVVRHGEPSAIMPKADGTIDSVTTTLKSTNGNIDLLGRVNVVNGLRGQVVVDATNGDVNLQGNISMVSGNSTVTAQNININTLPDKKYKMYIDSAELGILPGGITLPEGLETVGMNAAVVAGGANLKATGTGEAGDITIGGTLGLVMNTPVDKVVGSLMSLASGSEEPDMTQLGNIAKDLLQAGKATSLTSENGNINVGSQFNLVHGGGFPTTTEAENTNVLTLTANNGAVNIQGTANVVSGNVKVNAKDINLTGVVLSDKDMAKAASGLAGSLVNKIPYGDKIAATGILDKLVTKGSVNMVTGGATLDATGDITMSAKSVDDVGKIGNINAVIDTEIADVVDAVIGGNTDSLVQGSNHMTTLKADGNIDMLGRVNVVNGSYVTMEAGKEVNMQGNISMIGGAKVTADSININTDEAEKYKMYIDFTDLGGLVSENSPFAPIVDSISGIGVNAAIVAGGAKLTATDNITTGGTLGLVVNTPASSVMTSLMSYLGHQQETYMLYELLQPGTATTITSANGSIELGSQLNLVHGGGFTETAGENALKISAANGTVNVQGTANVVSGNVEVNANAIKLTGERLPADMASVAGDVVDGVAGLLPAGAKDLAGGMLDKLVQKGAANIVTGGATLTAGTGGITMSGVHETGAINAVLDTELPGVLQAFIERNNQYLIDGGTHRTTLKSDGNIDMLGRVNVVNGGMVVLDADGDVNLQGNASLISGGATVDAKNININTDESADYKMYIDSTDLGGLVSANSPFAPIVDSISGIGVNAGIVAGGAKLTATDNITMGGTLGLVMNTPMADVMTEVVSYLDHKQETWMVYQLLQKGTATTVTSTNGNIEVGAQFNLLHGGGFTANAGENALVLSAANGAVNVEGTFNVVSGNTQVIAQEIKMTGEILPADMAGVANGVVDSVADRFIGELPEAADNLLDRLVAKGNANMVTGGATLTATGENGITMSGAANAVIDTELTDVFEAFMERNTKPLEEGGNHQTTLTSAGNINMLGRLNVVNGSYVKLDAAQDVNLKGTLNMVSGGAKVHGNNINLVGQQNLGLNWDSLLPGDVGNYMDKMGVTDKLNKGVNGNLVLGGAMIEAKNDISISGMASVVMNTPLGSAFEALTTLRDNSWYPELWLAKDVLDDGIATTLTADGNIEMDSRLNMLHGGNIGNADAALKLTAGKEVNIAGTANIISGNTQVTAGEGIKITGKTSAGFNWENIVDALPEKYAGYGVLAKDMGILDKLSKGVNGSVIAGGATLIAESGDITMEGMATAVVDVTLNNVIEAVETMNGTPIMEGGAEDTTITAKEGNINLNSRLNLVNGGQVTVKAGQNVNMGGTFNVVSGNATVNAGTNIEMNAQNKVGVDISPMLNGHYAEIAKEMGMADVLENGVSSNIVAGGANLDAKGDVVMSGVATAIVDTTASNVIGAVKGNDLGELMKGGRSTTEVTAGNDIKLVSQMNVVNGGNTKNAGGVVLNAGHDVIMSGDIDVVNRATVEAGNAVAFNGDKSVVKYSDIYSGKVSFTGKNAEITDVNFNTASVEVIGTALVNTADSEVAISSLNVEIGNIENLGSLELKDAALAGATLHNAGSIAVNGAMTLNSATLSFVADSNNVANGGNLTFNSTAITLGADGSIAAGISTFSENSSTDMIAGVSFLLHYDGIEFKDNTNEFEYNLAIFQGATAEEHAMLKAAIAQNELTLTLDNGFHIESINSMEVKFSDSDGVVYISGTATVPEPTTATLSLLALAALAARRRRQK